MGRIPAINCDCWRLTRPLADGEALPDHVCEQTAFGTLYNAPPLAGASLTDELVWPVTFWDPNSPMSPPQQLALILRQWTEEPPNRTLAVELRELTAWDRAVAATRGDFVRWQRRHPDAVLADWIKDPIDERHMAPRLAPVGLPPTPATLRFLRACAARGAYRRPSRHHPGQRIQVATEDGVAELELPDLEAEEARRAAAYDEVMRADPEVYPARGLLITTLAFITTGPIEAYAAYDPRPLVRIEGPAEFATGEVWERAGATARRHRDGLRAHFQTHRLADPQWIHRAKARSFPKRSSDAVDGAYEVEAWTRIRQRMAMPDWPQRSISAQDDIINRILQQTQSAVAWRLKRANRPTRPPRGWRDAVRARVDAIRSSAAAS
jgi:hypothetical protein